MLAHGGQRTADPLREPGHIALALRQHPDDVQPRGRRQQPERGSRLRQHLDGGIPEAADICRHIALPFPRGPSARIRIPESC